MALLRSLRHRNYRLFFAGQLVSLVGTWMQSTAQGWLVYRLTGSPFMLGLASFVGHVPILFLAPLGGLWADDSWGRFWGWDPKENGALIIVLYNALVLHARWGGMVRQRGFMVLAIGGNIVTAWSWFGTNMLGVGLHSYGFMDAAFYWLTGFVISQVIIIALALIPLEKWRSFAGQPAAA